MAPTAVDYPAIVDLNRDGQADIVASSCNFDLDMHARLVVFHSPANALWAPARYVWNQHAYNVVNINNDLTIPAVNFNPATVFTDPQGIVRRPFNNFLQQATTLDQYGKPFMSMANLSSTSDTTVTYGNNSVSLSFTFCNNGGQILSSPFNITYYANNYHGSIIRTETINNSLPVGNCMTVTTQFTDGELLVSPGLTTIVVAINDNGTGVAQTGGQQEECDTTDNFFTFNVNPCSIPKDTVVVDVCVLETYTDQNFDIPSTATEAAGTYYFSRAYQVGGCDSVIVLKLRVHPQYNLHITETVPLGSSYDHNGIFLSESVLEGRGRIDTTITSQSVFGCDSVTHITILVAVADITLYLPNAITPSNSDGLNDFFCIPELIRDYLADFEILIYDRWGEMVFHSKDKNFNWYGDVKGKTYRNTIYQYVIHYSNLFGEKSATKGFVTVL